MPFPLRPAFSTAASLPPFAIIHLARLVSSPDLSSTSHLLVPAHLSNPRLLHPNAIWEHKPVLGGMVRATSTDGLLLLQFLDCAAATDAVIANIRAAGAGESIRIPSANMDMEPNVTRFICNPISCELFCLPGVNGTKKVPTWRQPQGLLTRSVRGHRPPDRYAVAELSVDGEGEGQRFVMRRFLSETGAWEKLEGLPSLCNEPQSLSTIKHK